MIVLMVMVYFMLGKPVFFRQQRAGYLGEPFMLFKFRTMPEGRDHLGQLLPDEERLGRFGQFLRSTSLDELPSLINVLIGDMSFIGPRPLLCEYLSLYTPEQSRRHDVKPGITGWAQVNGRNHVPWEQKFKMDVWYVDNKSISLDIKILIKTIASVFLRKGINTQDGGAMEPFVGRSDRE